ncbi:hypothetical protein GIB67_001765 [Kingdonia uniflora]|uniref:F-box domain-containing protein n=1 Tax=Kingdonia uniflora TaxID=39325 RepID=A0A7J7LBX6_9MAGN|nr:hypothetical protein GIB67_001765 [Kingdonia uniflora]
MMDGIGRGSESVNGDMGFIGIDNRSSLSRPGSRNTSPSSRTGSRNTSPSRVKTKPRGLDEETAATFGKSVHPDVQMEDNIWAMLPEDLLNEILARIPPFMIFRLRSVCKRWNSILQDSGFLKFHSKVPSHGPCLLTFSKNPPTQQCAVFSLPLKTWYKIPFAFLPLWAFWLVGSSAGLVCFSGLDGLTFKTLICNPLTQAWRTLPSMHFNQQRQLIMVADRIEKSFKVIATSEIFGDKTLPTEVYDSKLNMWSLHQTMPAVNLCSSKMAFCGSRLYLETLSPLGLMMYRMDIGYWEHIPAKFPRSLLDGYLVAGTHKRLFLVGRIGLYSTLQSMRIWELDHGKVIWVEISRMPPKYFRSLLRLSAERFECFGQDNLICFTSWNQGRGLLYDVDKKVWSWIAGCALQSYNSQKLCVTLQLDTLGYEVEIRGTSWEQPQEKGRLNTDWETSELFPVLATSLKMTMISDNNGDVATGGDVVSFDQELSKGIPTAVTRNGKLRGRKMLVNDVLSKGLMKGKGLNQETSKISGANHSKKGDLNIDSKLSDSSLLPVKVNMIGKGKNASDELLGESQTSSNHQDDISNVLRKAVDLSEYNKLNSQESENISLDIFEKTESKRLLEATNEIVNLMGKDYKGMKEPSRKPPINNNEPLNENDDGIKP